MGDTVSTQASGQPEITDKFLHGVVYVTVHSAKGLRNADLASAKQAFSDDVSDPYVTVSFDKFRLIKTSTANNQEVPRWEESFFADVACPGKYIYIKVKDKDTFTDDDLLGAHRFEVEKLFNEESYGGWLELHDENGKPNGGEIDIEIMYKSAETLKESIELPKSYFPLRTSCDVTLYQDAHTPENALYDNIMLPSGEAYSPTCAFQDMLSAIRGAKQFIYFTGWSVFTDTLMLRGEDDERITFGELLKEKAEEGVVVLGMIWNEKLSTEVTPGLMGTHDKETAKYFKDTNVKVVLVPRQRTGILADQFVSTCYSHHQKTIIVDAEGSSGDEKRRIVAFVGGLDLTDGRWDTPTHHLFNSLTTFHKEDFYNISAAVRPEVGPRQPWHDIHSRVQGRISHDIMQNFVERWHRQADGLGDMLLEVNEDEYDLDDVGGAEESDLWSVQMFRSINNESATFNPLNSIGLTGKKTRTCDNSIHRAYTHHIRRAKEFLYIENQYFQGGCNLWKFPETNSNNLIAVEITTKIVEKIRANERFAAYIVVPMHPEGDPASAAVQEMLHWQKNTMEMMYTRIAKELRRLGRTERPTDYLNFYCLGNREDTIPDGLSEPHSKSQEDTLRWSKRFMIYVHSKMLISDDEIIIVGSANINQRSMGGNRDTEIAIGAQQNEHTMKKVGGLPKGKVHAFRLALWAEHLACLNEVFLDPASLECVRAVNALAAKNWDYFTSKTASDMKGHLLQYPVQIREDGTITSLARWKKFLDTEAHILGKRSNYIPHKLTT